MRAASLGMPSYSSADRLLPNVNAKVAKRRNFFGYWPLWQEFFPLDAFTGNVDQMRLTANVLAGFIIGIRQTLSAIVSATLVFTTSGDASVEAMFPFGISMMWWSTLTGSIFYGFFGRLQYNTNATQEICAILYGAMATQAAAKLTETGNRERIPETVLALIVVSTVITGICSCLFGKLGIGKFMLAFPTPVTNGFLGTIGFFLVKEAFIITSGVDFKYFYPVSWTDFLALRSLGPLVCLMAMYFFMRIGPRYLVILFPRSGTVKRLSGLICQLLPLGAFYIVKLAIGVSLDSLSEDGWTYPAQQVGKFWTLWTTYDLRQADWGIVISQVPNMFSLVLMSILCTMSGVLGITGKFPSGPDGDPSPDDVVDFDAELTTVGVGAVVTGLTNGVVTFHRLGSTIQLRLDGGTHRVAVMSSACFVGLWFFSSLPLGHFIPKFYLGGLFMQSGWALLEQNVILAYKSLPRVKYHGYKVPSEQYWVAVVCVIVAAYSTPFTGIGTGLIMCLIFFIVHSSQVRPVSSTSDGKWTISRTMRPFWELKVLREEGDRIVILYLQGQLFFGSGQQLASAVADVVENSRVQYCILSFAKVTGIDNSACAQLQGALTRATRRQVKLIFCRMSPAIFEAIAAAGVITSPDKDLRDVLENAVQITEVQDMSPSACERQGAAEDDHSAGLGTRRPRAISWRAIGKGSHDAFDHETDALDYCSDQVLLSYGYKPETSLPVMVAYREACRQGSRLSDVVFEAMNSMPAGFMDRMREFCTILKPTPGHRLQDSTGLYFIFQGAVASVDRLKTNPESGGPAQFAGTHIKGFTGRGGHQRLRKRYPPGSVCNMTSFVLARKERLLDKELQAELVVSSKFGAYSEVWMLPSARYADLPLDIRTTIDELVMVHQSEQRQHTLLSGE